MKTLSSTLQSAIAGTITRPAWLVSISFPVPLYLSSYATVVIDGQTWTAADIDVSGVRVVGTEIGGQLVIGNADDVIGAMVLAHGVAGRQISIYAYDAAATSAADVVHVADAVGGEATLKESRASISLRESTRYVHTPRQMVAPPTFSQLLPAGARITLGGQVYVLHR